MFGKGSIDGLMAAETGDNACVPGAIIPVLTLAIPGSAPAAVLMAAMLIHGVRPGPMIMIEAPTFVYDVVAMMLFATLGILIYGLTLTQPADQGADGAQADHPADHLRAVRRRLVRDLVAAVRRLGDARASACSATCCAGCEYPIAPLVLGIVLGDLMEKGLRRGLVLSDGDLTPFFTRPISAVLWITIVARRRAEAPRRARAASARAPPCRPSKSSIDAARRPAPAPPVRPQGE